MTESGTVLAGLICHHSFLSFSSWRVYIQTSEVFVYLQVEGIHTAFSTQLIAWLKFVHVPVWVHICDPYTLCKCIAEVFDTGYMSQSVQAPKDHALQT